MFSLLALLLACDAPEVAASPADTGALPLDEAPPPGFNLQITPLVPGQLASFLVTGAPANSQVWFVRSFRTGNTCPPVLNGACVGLASPVVLGTASANAQGIASLSATLPVTTPVGLTVYAQAAVPSAGTVSNVVSGTTAGQCGDGLLQAGEACDDGNQRAGDGCDATCQIESGDTFRVRIDSADIAAHPPGGGQWDPQGLIAPFTYPDMAVQISINGVLIGETFTIDDSLHPTWNVETVVDVYPGDVLSFTLIDVEPLGLAPDLVRNFDMRRSDLDAVRNTGNVSQSGGPVNRFVIEVSDP